MIRRNFCCRIFSIAGIILTSTAASLMLATPFFVSKNYFELLPMKIWSPVPINRDNYWLFYFLQVFTIYLGAYATTISSLLFCGIIIEACSQLDILADRFKRIPEFVALKENVEKEIITKYIKHHKQIYQFVEFWILNTVTHNNTCIQNHNQWTYNDLCHKKFNVQVNGYVERYVFCSGSFWISDPASCHCIYCLQIIRGNKECIGNLNAHHLCTGCDLRTFCILCILTFFNNKGNIKVYHTWKHHFLIRNRVNRNNILKSSEIFLPLKMFFSKWKDIEYSQIRCLLFRMIAVFFIDNCTGWWVFWAVSRTNLMSGFPEKVTPCWKIPKNRNVFFFDNVFWF